MDNDAHTPMDGKSTYTATYLKHKVGPIGTGHFLSGAGGHRTKEECVYGRRGGAKKLKTCRRGGGADIKRFGVVLTQELEV